MIIFSLAVIFGLVLCALAYWANMRFRNEDRLSMQWWLSGEVTWSAPRRLALAFIPGLAVAVLSIFAIMSLTLQTRVGQVIGLGVIFVAIRLAHFWMVATTLRKNAD